MELYYYIAMAVIILQIAFLVQIYRNYHYGLSKYRRARTWYRPKTVLIIPCKGLEPSFDENITSFFNQDYENYLLWFVVADVSDPAYSQLQLLKDRLAQESKVTETRIFVAGPAKSCSQKLHNLLYCYQRIPDDIEVLAFADSDACVRSDWISHIVYPLHQAKYGAASGYRWFIPQRNNFASLTLSALNGKVAQLLGNSRFNQAWGGSMAIKVDIFRKVKLDEIWAKAVSDDLSLSYAVKKIGMKVAFVPACLVATYESTTWPRLFEFARRQFLITRVSSPKIWWFGLISCIYSILGLWGTAVMAVYVLTAQQTIPKDRIIFFVSVPIFFFASQLTRAIMRQKMVSKLLFENWSKIKIAAAVDIAFFWLWSILMLFFIVASAFGRTICWRGIRYKLISPTETIVVND